MAFSSSASASAAHAPLECVSSIVCQRLNLARQTESAVDCLLSLRGPQEEETVAQSPPQEVSCLLSLCQPRNGEEPCEDREAQTAAERVAEEPVVETQVETPMHGAAGSAPAVMEERKVSRASPTSEAGSTSACESEGEGEGEEEDDDEDEGEEDEDDDEDDEDGEGEEDEESGDEALGAPSEVKRRRLSTPVSDNGSSIATRQVAQVQPSPIQHNLNRPPAGRELVEEVD